MINIFRFIIFIFLFTISCSFNDVGGFWSKEENLKNENLNFKPLFKKDELTLKEFNQNFKFLLNQKELKINNNSANDNNDGFVIFDGKFEKIQKYNF